MTTTSPTIPKKTTNAETFDNVSQGFEDPSSVFMQMSNAEMDLREADMDASKVEESLAEAEKRMARCCMIATIAVLCLLIGAIVAFAIPQVRGRL